MKIKKSILVISVLLVIISVGLSVTIREKLLKTGQTVYFELAPIDPRSIMQGDYMTLNYRITRETNVDNIPSRGYIVFKLDSQNIAEKIRFQRNKTPLAEDEKIIKYFSHKRDISIGSESFFFQEGDAELYSKAMYGGIRVAINGESILFGLFDENRSEIKKNY